MTTLEDAWAWYRSAREGNRFLQSLAACWNDLPWGRPDFGTNRIRMTEAGDLHRIASVVDNPLDDLAVLVLFSVFEAQVRDAVIEQIRPEIAQLKHPALVKAGEAVEQAIEEGSFFRVLEPFKFPEAADLVEQVNQVRRYRNWVAHGRRQDNRPDASVDPRMAYERLRAFLALVRTHDRDAAIG